MRKIVLVVVLFAATFCRAQVSDYFRVFFPNEGQQGGVIQASPQKMMAAYTCDPQAFVYDRDSTACLHEFIQYNEEGWLTARWDYNREIVYLYEYDAKGRVTAYTEKGIRAVDTATYLRLLISYHRKGYITAITNTARGYNARSATYYESEKKLIIATPDGFTDEIFFADGRILKIGSSSAGMATYTAAFTYNEDGKIIKQEGYQVTEGVQYNYNTAKVYNAQGQKVQETETLWPNNKPYEKNVSQMQYDYNDSGRLIKLDTRATNNGPLDNIYTNYYTYDALNRKAQTDYYKGEELLFSFYYRYY